MKPNPLSHPVIPSIAEFQVPAQWQWHWRALRKLQDRLQYQTRARLTEAEQLPKGDWDFAARAADESEFESLIAEYQSEEGLLAEVVAALERLRRGTYGRCEATGEPIPLERLRVLPWTRFRREAVPEAKQNPRGSG